jgi:NADH-quinone oxidoreductase subunit G
MTAIERPNTVTLTIDGADVTVPTGTLVVEACRLAGIEVPVFCYHPKLSIIGACRMCICEIAMAPPPGQPARPPALMTTCTTRVTPGMVVNTMADKVLKAREGVIEFLLINHPLDCPVCDAGGECPLQDNSHAWGPKESRFEEDKRLARKGAALSPLVVLDQERCIVCFRCTRFMAEVPGEAELDFFNRGYSSELRVINEESMRSRFHGNIIDLCPCGALTSETYRFKSRPHDLDHADSVCAQCPVGCNMIVDTRDNQIARIRPRQNEAVNEIWLCDKGRFAHHYVSHPDRLTQPLIKGEGGTLRSATWPEATGSAAVALQEIKTQHGPQAIGLIGGRNLTNEDCYALARFAEEVLETPNVDHRIGARSRTVNPLAAHGLDAFNTEFIDAQDADAIFLLGSDIYEEMPVLWLGVRKGVRNGAKLVIANPRSTEADRLAFRRLRYRPGSELAVLRALAAALVESPPMASPMPATPPAEGQAAGAAPEPQPRDLSGLRDALGGTTVDQAAVECGVSADAIRGAAAALAGAKRPVIYAGSRLAIRGDAEQLAAGLVNLAEALGTRHAIGYFADGANARGAAYAGLVPGEGGLAAGEIIAQAAAGKIRALYLVGENILETHPDREQAQRALANAEVVIVHELFPTGTAQAADIVFAATSVPEKDGSLTNAEGRIQRIHRAVITDTGGARPDWRILSDLAAEMGSSLGYAAAPEITRDLLADLPVYAPTNGNLPAEGLVCREFETQPDGAAGTSTTSGFLPYDAPSSGHPRGGIDMPDALTLITYSELLGDETVVRATAELLEMVPEAYVEVNQTDAARLELTQGQLVDLATDRGRIQRIVRINGRCPEGVCFTPDNIGQPRVNAILDWNAPHTKITLAPVLEPVAVG